MPSSAKRYKLHSAPENGDKPVCAFFSSPGGCRNGDSCKFLHINSEESEEAPHLVLPTTEVSSVVSTESEGETKDPFVSRGKSTSQTEKIETMKGSDTKKKRKKRKSLNDDPFANPKRRAVGAKSPPMPLKDPSKTKEHEPVKQSRPESNSTPSYLQLNLPVAPFSVLGSSRSQSNSQVDSHPSKAETTPQKTEESGKVQPLPQSHPNGRTWLQCVLDTRKHERYPASFDFEKYKQTFEENGRCPESQWVVAKPYGKWSESLPQVIAIDCEMCETQDPVSGVKNPNALCRVSIVNGENPDEVLLDSLVKPVWPVTDYRTWVNGIKKEDLERVEFTLRHAQAFMMAICSEETVIVGHAVNNDLTALRMEHYCVADSSFLFKVKDQPASSCPSLKDLARNVLKKDMPDTHDSVNDARTAFLCVKHYVDSGGKVEPVERGENRKTSNARKLFIHRVPVQCQPAHIENMLLKHTSVKPNEVEDIVFSGGYGKTYAVFRSPKHASLAFASLEGGGEEDASGRLQKKVFLRTGSYVRVRKMVHERRRSEPSGSPDKQE